MCLRYVASLACVPLPSPQLTLSSACLSGPEFGDPAKENEPLFSKIARSFAHEQNADKQQRTALFDRGNPKRYLNRTTKVDTLADCASDQDVRPDRVIICDVITSANLPLPHFSPDRRQAGRGCVEPQLPVWQND